MCIPIHFAATTAQMADALPGVLANWLRSARPPVKPRYDCIYLAPHPDDAVFSCAGSIARRVERRESVLVVTACTAAPPAGIPGEFAASLHHRWGLPDDQVVQMRLAEDSRALELLGVDSLHLGFLDAIYRRPDAYDTHDGLFGTLAPDDNLACEIRQMVERLCCEWPHADVVAPLGVAGHVDHQAAHSAARALEALGTRVSYYEDLPYATEPGSVERQLAKLGVASHAVANREDISGVLDLKVAAMRCYTSQVRDLPNLPEEAAAYARRLGGDIAVERTWALASAAPPG
jgi:LmbE family N-acetylglucosaminyl deacetylase